MCVLYNSIRDHLNALNKKRLKETDMLLNFYYVIHTDCMDYKCHKFKDEVKSTNLIGGFGGL